jgi:hydroxymethylpyrimidine/phosphomethylpyrimidine kinase
MKGRILVVGELIASGGLGLQGDIITVTALGAQALTVPTFLSTSIQPSNRKIHDVSPDFVLHDMQLCLKTPGVDAIKVGAINSAAVAKAVAAQVSHRSAGVPLVVNPVLTTEVGGNLLDDEGMDILKNQIIACADLTVLTVRDAELLSGHEVFSLSDMYDAAKVLHKLGSKAVLITGGLLQGEELHDVLVSSQGEEVLTLRKHDKHQIESYRFGGAWALSTAIATSLGQGFSLKDSIGRARQFVDRAIGTSFNADEVYQNLNLAHTIHPFVHDDSSAPYTIVARGKFAG